MIPVFPVYVKLYSIQAALSMLCNLITDTSVACLCKALQHLNCTLTTLRMQHCEITNIGVASLCEALQHPSCKLTTLDLEDTDITDIGVASLCEALQHPSCKLTTLELPLSVYEDEMAASLEAIIRRHRPALKLSFH